MGGHVFQTPAVIIIISTIITLISNVQAPTLWLAENNQGLFSGPLC